jgi:hypothetical protein
VPIDLEKENLPGFVRTVEIVRKAGRNKDFWPLQPDVLEDLYHEQEMSLQEIGDLVDVNSSTVRGRMMKYGIPRRAPNGDSA